MKSNVSACREILRVAGVETLVDIAGHAGDAEFLANVAGGAAAAHRVEHQAGAEKRQQVLDELAAAVAGPVPVAIFSGPVEVIQAGQVRHRAAGDRCPWQSGVNRLSRLCLAGRGRTGGCGRHRTD